VTKSASVSVPLVSFLTTVYRTEDSLPATIESVLAQTSPDWEMVVVDNGLSPRVVEIVSKYAHHGRIRLIRQENRGYRGGVTAAAETATGRYLSVLDSDDKIMPSFVSAMTDVVAAEPGIDAVGCDAVQFDDSEQAHLPSRYLASLGVQWQPRYASQPLTLSDALAGVIPYYTGIVRREAWQQVGGYAAHDPDVDESVMIWLRLVQLCDVRLIDAPLGWYRIRGDSLSRDPAKKEAFEQALITAFSRTALCTASARDRVIAEDTVARLRYHQELRRARWALMDGEIRSARRHARLAFAYSPGLRPGLVVASLAISPAMLRWFHPHKQRAAAVGLRVRERWVTRRRGLGRRSTSAIR
jgi:glycosyltransferase involved in cell wall biosynthesis